MQDLLSLALCWTLHIGRSTRQIGIVVGRTRRTQTRTETQRRMQSVKHPAVVSGLLVIGKISLASVIMDVTAEVQTCLIPQIQCMKCRNVTAVDGGYQHTRLMTPTLVFCDSATMASGSKVTQTVHARWAFLVMVSGWARLLANVVQLAKMHEKMHETNGRKNVRTNA